MSYVWSEEQVKRYLSYYQDIRTHHSWAYASFAVDAEFARNVLPPCLEVAAEPTVSIQFGAFMEWIQGTPNRAGRDQGCLIGINARLGEIEGIYYLSAIEEDEVNIVTGRELWGMPKKMGKVDFFDDTTEFFGLAERAGHRLVEMKANIGDPIEPSDGDEVDYMFELRGYFGPNGVGLSGVQLVVFENQNLIKGGHEFTGASVVLGPSPVDPGVATIPLGDFVEGGQIGGETSYIVKEIKHLDADGNDYAPYLLGRLYDAWPDVEDVAGRIIK